MLGRIHCQLHVSPYPTLLSPNPSQPLPSTSVLCQLTPALCTQATNISTNEPKLEKPH